jgi:hypothetical protein
MMIGAHVIGRPTEVTASIGHLTPLGDGKVKPVSLLADSPKRYTLTLKASNIRLQIAQASLTDFAPLGDGAFRSLANHPSASILAFIPLGDGRIGWRDWHAALHIAKDMPTDNRAVKPPEIGKLKFAGMVLAKAISVPSSSRACQLVTDKGFGMTIAYCKRRATGNGKGSPKAPRSILGIGVGVALRITPARTIAPT